MTKKTLFKRIASVAMAGALTLSMALPVGAATTDPVLVVEENTLYSTPIKAGEEVTLGLMPGVIRSNYVYARTGFDSAEDAAKGLKVTKVNFGGERINTNYVYGSMETKDSDKNPTYAGTVTVKGAKNAYGPASFQVKNTFVDDAVIDMTVFVEAVDKVADATGVFVEAVDLSSDDATMYEVNEDATVSRAKDDTSANPFKDSDGAAQTYPTASNALYELAESNSMTIAQRNGFVESITDTNGTELTTYISNGGDYYGWNYCVVHNGTKVAEGDLVSASILPIETGDSVYWAFGTYNQAQDYFDMLG